MRFKIDENLPEELAALLTARGHNAITVTAQRLKGQPDARIAQVCAQEDRILVTLDLDFANIRAYPPQDYPGFVVLRVARQDKRFLLRVFQNALPSLDQAPWQHQLWIVEETGIRVRGGS